MNCTECGNPPFAPHAAVCSRYTPDMHRVDGKTCPCLDPWCPTRGRHADDYTDRGIIRGRRQTMANYTSPGRFTTGLGGHKVYSCQECGALVDNTATHDKWHSGLAGHSHHTLSVIGGALPPADDSVLRSGGQTKEYGPRPRISTTRPNLP